MSESIEAGFTLIELLVVMAVAGLLLAGFTTFYLSGQRATRRHQLEIEASQALRTALEQISRDLRSARRDPVNFPNNQPSFVTATPSTVEFQLDYDDNGAALSTDPNEHKGYRLNGTTIEQLDTSTNTWVSLANNVSALTFGYYDCSGVTTAVLASIATVDVTITVTPAIIGSSSSRTETERVRLRNVRC